MKKSKAILMALCAVLLVAASVMGTLAYLTSTDSVTNTFTVGNVKITLDEKDTDEDTNTDDNVTVNGVIRDKANVYHLLPGHTYTKDPIVRVDANSENCYLFVKVVNEIAAIEEKGTNEAPATTTVAAQMAAKGWAAVDPDNGIYVYGTADAPTAVAGGESVTVFEKFVIDDDVNNTTLANYNNKTITVTAYAVQADGFETKTAAQIWGDAGFT